jgi:flagellar biosynthetic protein FliR
VSPLAGHASEAVLAAFLVFCRIGACFLVAPGLGNARVPVNVRLFLALALALALTPVVWADVRPLADPADPAALLSAIGGELAIGLLIGFLARLFLAALQTVAVAAGQSVGLGGLPATPIVDEAPVPAVAALFTLTATALVFVLDLHWELLRGLVASYGTLPPGRPVDPGAGLSDVAAVLADAFLLALRVMSPFILFAVVVNFAIGLVNKLTPQIPAFFIALPFMIAGALFLMALTIREILATFTDAWGAWIASP